MLRGCFFTSLLLVACGPSVESVEPAGDGGESSGGGLDPDGALAEPEDASYEFSCDNDAELRLRIEAYPGIGRRYCGAPANADRSDAYIFVELRDWDGLAGTYAVGDTTQVTAALGPDPQGDSPVGTVTLEVAEPFELRRAVLELENETRSVDGHLDFVFCPEPTRGRSCR